MIQPVGYKDLTAEKAVDLVYAFLSDKELHKPEVSIPAKDTISGYDGTKRDLHLKLQSANWFSTSVAAFDKADQHRVILATAKGENGIMVMIQIYDEADVAAREKLLDRLETIRHDE